MIAPAAPCRKAEAALLAGGLPVPDEVATHSSFCDACGPLLASFEENEALLSSLAVPRPGAAFDERLREVPRTVPPRLEAREVLSLLAPGALAAPEPSPALLRKLLAVPAGRRRRAEPAVVRGRFRRLSTDWRVLVVAAYAACLALVAVLGVDPLSAARSGASGLSAAGERAISEARVVAGEKLETVLTSHRRRPLTQQLDYRVYRTLAVGKAKTAAWAEILLGRLFGRRVEATEPPPRPMREPAPPALRSLDRAETDAPLHRTQRA